MRSREVDNINASNKGKLLTCKLPSFDMLNSWLKFVLGDS